MSLALQLQNARLQEELEDVSSKLATSQAHANALQEKLIRLTKKLVVASKLEEARDQTALAEALIEISFLASQNQHMNDTFGQMTRYLREEIEKTKAEVTKRVNEMKLWVAIETKRALETQRANALSAFEAVVMGCCLSTDLALFDAAVIAHPLDVSARMRLVEATRCTENAELRNRLSVAERDSIRAKRVAVRLKRVRERDYLKFAQQLNETQVAYERFVADHPRFYDHPPQTSSFE